MADKFVDYKQYCPKCMYWEKKETEDPCWECLDNPVNEDSHKPKEYKEKA